MPKKRATKKRGQTRRLERLVELQKKAVKDWGAYSQNAATLIAKGTVSPDAWMKEYTNLSQSVVHNFGELMRIISGDR